MKPTIENQQHDYVEPEDIDNEQQSWVILFGWTILIVGFGAGSTALGFFIYDIICGKHFLKYY